MVNAQADRAIALLKSNGMLRLRDFLAHDIEPETLSRLVREERLVRPARGLYQLPDTQVESAYTFAEAAVLVPKGIVCLISALQFHGLTLQMPSSVWMANRAHRMAANLQLSPRPFRSLQRLVHERGS